VLILLPPSEGKSAAQSGPHLDLAALSYPALTSTRRRVLDALIRLCRSDIDDAATTLGLGPTQRGEVGANTLLRTEPCAAAIDVYTGVLYEALDAASLTARARTRLDAHVVIASALWGLVAPHDLIPSYRLSAATTLPGIGTLASNWRQPVGHVLAQVEDVIIDMRSGAYVSLAPVTIQSPGRVAAVRVLTERNGTRTVVSHFNKATKGRITRTLVQSRRTPTDVNGVADILAGAGYRVEHQAARRGGADVLDVIVEDV
jgi:cytoplasmic iron level regulating protein YaaA (DUF328/UPF0246 family)